MKRIGSLFLVLILLFSQTSVLADGEEYLVLGADLTPTEEATVLDLLGVDNIDNYNVSYITNAEEYAALGNYLPPEVIGSRALSSVKLSANRKGIDVNTQNINYVTEEMYQNALITAGVKNVTLDVAGPSNISGTAALVAATKAYEIMTGEAVNQENVDVANEELVVTQDLADEIGESDATELVAALKQDIAGHDYTTEEISNALDNIEGQMDVTLSPEMREQVISLMERVNQLDLDPEILKAQAENIYNNIKGYLGDLQNTGFFDSITQAVQNFINTIINFFSGNANVEQ